MQISDRAVGKRLLEFFGDPDQGWPLKPEVLKQLDPRKVKIKTFSVRVSSWQTQDKPSKS